MVQLQENINGQPQKSGQLWCSICSSVVHFTSTAFFGSIVQLLLKDQKKTTWILNKGQQSSAENGVKFRLVPHRTIKKPSLQWKEYYIKTMEKF